MMSVMMTTTTSSLRPFVGMGVTSILPDPSKVDDDRNTISFYVGTKRGKLKKVTMKSSHVLRDDDDDIAIQDIIYMEENHKTPYPIFSMISLPTTTAATANKGRSNDGHVVLVGSGDRYITIWEQNNDAVAESSWRIQEKLGPHTGWVKDLALSKSKQEGEKERFIFSIGCNCIEVWKTNMLDDDGGARRYDHVHKLKIESSVDMGMTLSSDILCLATTSLFHNSIIVADQTKKKQQEELKQSNDTYWLFAGGVDGRIHRWTICNNSFRDAEVVYAPGHDGRVNALLLCHKLQVAVSIGSDGCINCWMLDIDASSCNKNEEVTSFLKRRIWSMNVTDSILFQQNNAKAQDTTIKLTASCILCEQHDHAIIGVGTACGKVFLTNIIESSSSSDSIMSISLLEEWINVESSSSSGTARDGRGCSIHSLATQNNHLIIGHSDGISIWQPSW